VPLAWRLGRACGGALRRAPSIKDGI
jgi:hypothetical protein